MRSESLIISVLAKTCDQGGYEERQLKAITHWMELKRAFSLHQG